MQYKILRRQKLRPRTPKAVLHSPTLEEVKKLLPESKFGSLYTIDIETIGRQAFLPSADIIGIGLADADGCLYIDLRSCSEDARQYLGTFLRNIRLIAFNTLFEASWLRWFTGEWLNWEGCAYGLFKQLSGEGWAGQRWGLDIAEEHILGWPSTNKEKMDRILREHKLTKETMWQLPAELLGPYCAADADAAWQLWHYLLRVCEESIFGEHSLRYHKREFMTEVRLLVEQQIHGMQVDTEGLFSYHADLKRRINAALDAFLYHHDVAPHVSRYNAAILKEWRRSAPPKRTAKGVISCRWLQWRDRNLNWFNANSDKDKRWLFYECIYSVVKEKHKSVTIKVGDKEYEVEKTDGGKSGVRQRSCNKKILALFGESGMLLRHYNELVKEEGYVRAAVALALRDAGVLRPDYNSIGTITGRLSGGQFDG